MYPYILLRTPMNLSVLSAVLFPRITILNKYIWTVSLPQRSWRARMLPVLLTSSRQWERNLASALSSVCLWIRKMFLPRSRTALLQHYNLCSAVRLHKTISGKVFGSLHIICRLSFYHIEKGHDLFVWPCPLNI